MKKTTKKATKKAAAKMLKVHAKTVSRKPRASKAIPDATPEIEKAIVAPVAPPAPEITVDDLKAKGIKIAPKPIDAARVQALTIGINLNCVRFGNRKQADMSEVDMHGTDEAMVVLTKQLVKSKELTAIVMHDYRAGLYLRTIGLPSFFRPGTHRIPIAAVDEVETELKRLAEVRATLVDAFIAKYPSLIEEMRGPLGPQFKLSDYPTPEAARARFEFSWRWFEIDGAPGRLATISDAAFQSAREKVEASMMEIAQGCRMALRGACKEIVATISHRLTPKAGEEAKKFRASTLFRDVQEFFRTFEMRNVTDDAELRAVVKRLADLTSGADLDTVKTDAALQVEFKKSIDAVAASLDELLIDAGDRVITLA